LVHWLQQTYGRRFIHITNVRGLNLNHLLAQIKVVVGDSYYVKHYWSNRVYEITGRGGFLLFPRTEGLEEEFTAGAHIATYPRVEYLDNDYDRWYATLRETIDHWLSHDDERERIRHQGHVRCGEYTYTRRTACLLRTLQRLGYIS